MRNPLCTNNRGKVPGLRGSGLFVDSILIHPFHRQNKLFLFLRYNVVFSHYYVVKIRHHNCCTEGNHAEPHGTLSRKADSYQKRLFIQSERVGIFGRVLQLAASFYDI